MPYDPNAGSGIAPPRTSSSSGYSPGPAAKKTTKKKSAPFDFGAGGGLAALQAAAGKSHSGGILDFAKGPVAAVFDIASRPGYAVGNLIKGDYGEAAKPFYRQKFNRVLPGQALQERGILPKHGVLGAISRFAADVALDPTTYVTFGAGGVAKSAAATAAREASAKFGARVAADAARGVRTPVAAVAEHAARQSAFRAATPKALSVGVRVPFTRGKALTLASSEGAYNKLRSPIDRVGATRGGEAIREALVKHGAADRGVHETYIGARRAGDAEKHAISREAVRLNKEIGQAEKNLGLKRGEGSDAITRWLDNPGGRTLPDGLHGFADRAKSLLDTFHQQEQVAGLDKNLVDTYVPHLPATQRDRQSYQQMFNRQPGTPFFMKERALPNLDAWAAHGLTPETNIAKLVEVRGHASVDERVRRGFEQAVAKQHGMAIPSGSTPQLFWQQFPAAHFAGTQVPSHVAEAVQRVHAEITPAVTNRGIDETRRFISRVTGSWKSLALLSPGYHSRNLQSDMMAAYWAGARNPASFVQSARILTGRGAVNVKGTTYTAKQFNGILESYGITKSGQAGKEIREGVASGEVTGRGIQAPGHGRIARASRTVGQAREDATRAGLFIERLKAGDSFDEAAGKIFEYLFDYGDTGKFVSAARRFWFPFITYPSKALPMVAKTFAGRPGIPANLNKLVQETNQAEGVDTGLLLPGQKASFALPIPDRVKSLLGAPTDQPLLYNPESALPYGQLNQLDPRQLEHYALGGLLTPFVRAPVEYQTKHSFYTGNDFTKRVKAPAVIVGLNRLGVPTPGYGPKKDTFTGRQVPGYSPRLDTILRLLPQYSQTAGLIPGGGTESSRLSRARYFGGLNLSPYDRARQLYYASKYGGR